MFGLKEKLKAECKKEILSEPMFYGIVKYEDLYKRYIKLDDEELAFIYKLLQYASSTLPEQEEVVVEQFYNIGRKVRRIFSKRKRNVKLPKLKIENKYDRLDGDFTCLAMILHNLDERFAIYHDYYLFNNKYKEFGVIEYRIDTDEKIKIALCDNISYRILNDEYYNDPRFKEAIKFIEDHFKRHNYLEPPKDKDNPFKSTLGDDELVVLRDLLREKIYRIDSLDKERLMLYIDLCRKLEMEIIERWKYGKEARK